MAKRKISEVKKNDSLNATSKQTNSSHVFTSKGDNQVKRQKKLPSKSCTPLQKNITIQIIVGTYEKILHGVTATFRTEDFGSEKDSLNADFAETFLFNAHGSAIRCLAISPPSLSTDATISQKAILATGSSDHSINLYHISTSPAQQLGGTTSSLSLAGRTIIENPRNRELGSLHHHSSSINALYFPTRSKLLSAAEDNTVAVIRTRDWTVLSTIKPPIPKAHGRPSGDTAPFGGTPTGVNDFAIHPSMKLMVTVGKGEKCMRLWNLITGKKAGVLNFSKELLQGVGKGKWGIGEGRKVRWNSLGEEFVVGFEKGAVVFGMDSKPKCKILPSPLTKIHQLHYLTIPKANGKALSELLAVSTEEGRIQFFDTNSEGSFKPGAKTEENSAPTVQALAQLGGPEEGIISRIKDFEILKLVANGELREYLVVVAGSSDGIIRLWALDGTKFATITESLGRGFNPNHTSTGTMPEVPSAGQIGRLIGTYETGNRITCLKAFVMSHLMEMKVNETSDENLGNDINGVGENESDSHGS